MADETALNIEIRLGMEAAGKIVRVTEMIQSDFAHARHQPHVKHYIDAVGHLDADFAETRSRRPHEKRNDVKRPPAHRAGEDLAELVVGLRRRHPVIVGTGLFLLVGTNESQILRARHIVLRAAVQVTTWHFLLIERQQIAALHGDLGQLFSFFFRTIAPIDALGLAHRRHAINPILNMRICRHRSCYITHG